MDDFFINPGRLSSLAMHMLDMRNAAASRSMEEQQSIAHRMQVIGESSFEYQIREGRAIIPVRGALVSSQMPGWYWYGNLTYESLVATIEEAVYNPDVSEIVLSFYSPGGTVTGCAEAGARIHELSKEKSIISHCQQADSAAYWLAAATSKIIVDPSGEVGSIGTIMMHMDISKMLKELGVDVTMIFSGKHKGDGWPYDPLSKEAKARYQHDVDYLRGLFVDAVAEYRGIDSKKVSATEALTYKGANAIAEQLADETGFLGALLKSQVTTHENSKTHQARKENTMTKKERAKKEEAEKMKLSAAQNAENEGDEEEENTEEEDGKASDTDEDKAEDKDEGSDESGDDEAGDGEEEEAKSEKNKSEKKRISAILGSKHAEGKQELAKALAFDTDLSVKDAEKLLQASSSETKSAKNPLADAMSAHGSPKIGQPGNSSQTSKNPLLASAQTHKPSALKKSA